MRNKKMALAAIAAGLMILAAGCGDKESYTEYDNTKTEGTKTSGNAGTKQGSGQNASGQITEEEAKKIALENAKVAENDVTAIQVKKEIDEGISLYNVEFYAGTKEYDYEISAADGSILSADFDVENDFNNGGNTANTSGTRISEADAKKAVLERAKGAKEENIRMNLEVDDGMQVYEGSVVSGETKYEFEMNAENGEFISWEQESIYD